MKLKQRLLLANLSLIAIPTAVTIVLGSVLLYIFSYFTGSGISYENFESAMKIRFEMFSAAENIWKTSPESLARQEFGVFLASKMNDIKAQIFILSEDEVMFATQGVFNIDISVLKEAGLIESGNTVSVGDTSFLIQSHEFIGQDLKNFEIHFLIPTDSKIKQTEAFVFLLVALFLLSAVAVSAIVTNKLLKNIAAPVTKLNNVVFEISKGNLSQEIAEDGIDEIKELFRSIEQMRIKLLESVRNRERIDMNRQTLISNISHDLKTPITSIKGYVEGLRDNIANTPEKKKKYIETIYSKANLMDKMIDDLVFFSKLELGKAPYNFEQTDSVSYFRDCVEENTKDLENVGIKLIFENNLANSPKINIDRERMKRVMQNLLENATKYRKEDLGQVILLLRDASDRIIVEIKDNGIGIPKESLPFIFDRFYRADNSRGRIEGSGLGLSIAKQIIKDHGGYIWAVSKENEGTSIMISLKIQGAK